MSPNVCRLTCCLVMLLSFSVGATAKTQQKYNGLDVLKSVAHATKYSNYTGEFTYEYDGKIDMLSISHSVVDGNEIEVLRHLSGPEKNISRSTPLNHCQPAKANSLVGNALPFLNSKKVNLNENYQFISRGIERVAGRESVVVQVLPSDIYRYGLVLAIDKASGLLSKVVITEGSNRVMERIQFVSLEVAPNKTFDNPNKPENEANDCQIKSIESKAPLTPSWIPVGFVLAGYHFSDEGGHMETYTDGLSAFSVFISNSAVGSAQIITRKGATVSLLAQVAAKDKTYSISVVGEIPAVAARRLAQSFTLRNTPSS